ncbi:MAG: 3-dehydroquinate synthase [Candidatus Omnitrophota bacterium]
MRSIRVHLKERSYDIAIGTDLIKRVGALLQKLHLGDHAIVITNKRLFGFYGKKIKASLAKSGIAAKFEMVPDSEKAKTADISLNLINKIAAYDKAKTLFIIAFGGGVIGDLTGFVAAIYKRGTPYVQIPTTLLAQVDSAIGGKTAIDLPVAKNLVGAFSQPRMVISDISVTKTLSPRQMRSGLAEIIKYGVIKDKRLFEFLENNLGKILKHDPAALEYIVAASSLIKTKVVERDELDRTGLRAILNLGHTIGHAIEAADEYSGKYNHGESIAIGMCAASEIALEAGLIKPQDVARIKNLIEKSGLPVKTSGLKFNKVYESLKHDKKFIHGKPRLILPTSIGRAKVVGGVGNAVITRILKKYI